jgi:hypothetical protein
VLPSCWIESSIRSARATPTQPATRISAAIFDTDWRNHFKYRRSPAAMGTKMISGTS